jgi:hypothetical protein
MSPAATLQMAARPLPVHTVPTVLQTSTLIQTLAFRTRTAGETLASSSLSLLSM